MNEQQPVEPLLEPAEGQRPEDAEKYAQAELELTESPQEEPAEGARDSSVASGDSL